MKIERKKMFRRWLPRRRPVTEVVKRRNVEYLKRLRVALQEDFQNFFQICCRFIIETKISRETSDSAPILVDKS